MHFGTILIDVYFIYPMTCWQHIQGKYILDRSEYVIADEKNCKIVGNKKIEKV